METSVALFVVVLSLMVAMALAKPGTPSLTVSPDPATVDAGTTVTFTCVKNPNDAADPTVWEFYIGTGAKETTGVSGAVFSYVAVLGDTGKDVTCKAGDGTDISDAASTGKTLAITAIPAPTLKSSIAESGGKVTVVNGSPVKFTCAKGASKQDPVRFKFYEGTTEITGSTTGAAIAGGELTVTASSTWEAKVIKCTHYNTATAKTDSATTFTLAVALFPAPPTIDFTTPLKEGAELTVTCAKVGDIVATEFEIYKDGAVLTDGITSSSGTLKDKYTKAKVTKADDNGKKFKCLAKNTLGSSGFSAEKTLVVEGVEGAEAGAASQLVSMTTMALVLALGAFFKE